ncbi:MAG TPA: transporter [Flavisolibacter sp.]|nr:transporter [Flavisolibacter sp.]
MLSVFGFSQEEKIQADRPGETLTPQLTKTGWFQLETGFEKKQENKDDYSLMHPELQIKYGLSRRFEIKAELTAESEKQNSTGKFQYGLKPVEIGLKALLLEEKGLLPTTTLYTQVGIPMLASKDHQTTHAAPKVRLLFENQFAKIFHLNYNIGAEWSGEGTQPRWMYSIDQEIELSNTWEVFIETFGHFQQGQAAQHNLDGGVSYFPTSNIKFDVYAGKGISKESPDYFISAGVSFRLK